MSADQEVQDGAAPSTSATIWKASTALATGALYLFFITIVFVGFSAYVTRAAYDQALAADNDDIRKLDDVIFLFKSINLIKTHMDGVELEIEGFNSQKQAHLSERSLLEQENISTSQEIERLTRSMTRYIVEKQDDLDLVQVPVLQKAPALDTAGLRSYVSDYSSTFSSITASQSKSDETRNNFDRILKTTLSGYTLNIETVILNQREIDKRSHQIDALDEKLTKARLHYQRMEQQLSDSEEKFNPQHQATVETLLDTPFSVLYHVTKLPTIILTLIVTIASGGLGSTVSFSRKFFRSTEQADAHMLMVNTGEGVAAAVAIFLFAGTGMLALTQGASGSDGGLELSPYLVAFLAFVSGFMAEDAFGRIQAAGRAFFSEGNGDAPVNGSGPRPASGSPPPAPD